MGVQGTDNEERVSRKGNTGKDYKNSIIQKVLFLADQQTFADL